MLSQNHPHFARSIRSRIYSLSHCHFLRVLITSCSRTIRFLFFPSCTPLFVPPPVSFPADTGIRVFHSRLGGRSWSSIAGKGCWSRGWAGAGVGGEAGGGAGAGEEVEGRAGAGNEPEGND